LNAYHNYYQQRIRRWCGNKLLLNERHLARSIMQTIGEFGN
jgi:hypothetical protein